MRFAVHMAALALLAAGSASPADPGVEASRSYRIVTDGSTRTAKVGEKGKLVLVIEPTAPKIHVNAEAPLKIKLEAPAGLKLAKAELGHGDAAKPGADAPRFEVPFTAAAAGRQEARAAMKFYICSDTWCVQQTRDVAIPVDVK
jgi:hypothetical protein